MIRLVAAAAILVALTSWGQDTTPTPTSEPVPYPLKSKAATPTETTAGGRGGLTSNKIMEKPTSSTPGAKVKSQGKGVTTTASPKTTNK